MLAQLFRPSFVTVALRSKTLRDLRLLATPGILDRYGPEAQSDLQDRAMARLDLTDSGLAWRAAHWGRTVYRRAWMVAMLAAAQRGDFDVLLVGYASRWQRNLRRTLGRGPGLFLRRGDPLVQRAPLVSQ